MDLGSVVDKGEGRFEWIIPGFPEIPRTDIDFDSPWFLAEGEKWHLRMLPNGYAGNIRILIRLFRLTSISGKSLSCTMAVKRADQSEETMGEKDCTWHVYYTFDRARKDLEKEGGWFPDGQLTVTLLFRGAKEDSTSVPRDIRTEQSGSAIDQDSRRDDSTPSEAKENRKLISRETQTDVWDFRISKNERLEDCTCTGAKGVRQLSENLKGLLTDGHKNYDVTLFVKGKEFRAHKCILEARSPVLGMMLNQDSKEKNSGTIDITDCDPDCFQEILLFLYSGCTENLDARRALGLYYAADKYDLPLLKEECVQFLGASLSTASVCDVVLLAARHGEEQLLRTATEYFAKNLQTTLFSVEWQIFMAQNSTVANELLIKGLQNLGHLT